MTSCDLDEKEMLMLAREGNDETRKKLARRVVRQAEQKEPTSLSNVEINNVAELQVKRGMLKAIPALPDERQLEMLLLKKTISRHDVNFISEATTTSKPLMEYIFKHIVFDCIF